MSTSPLNIQSPTFYFGLANYGSQYCVQCNNTVLSCNLVLCTCMHCCNTQIQNYIKFSLHELEIFCKKIWGRAKQRRGKGFPPLSLSHLRFLPWKEAITNQLGLAQNSHNHSSEETKLWVSLSVLLIIIHTSYSALHATVLTCMLVTSIVQLWFFFTNLISSVLRHQRWTACHLCYYGVEMHAVLHSIFVCIIL